MIVVLLSILGLASSFSTPTLQKCALSTRFLARQKSFCHELSAIPKHDQKENPFKAQALAFLNKYNEVSEVGEEISDDIEAFENDLFRQKLEFEASLQSDSTLQSGLFTSTPEIYESEQGSALMPITESSVVVENEPLLSHVWKARLLLLAAAALYGTNFTFVKILNEDVPVQIGTSMRFILASAVTMPWLFKKKQSDVSVLAQNGDTSIIENALDASSMGAILGGFEVGLWNGIGYISQAIGLETTPASTSAFICSLAVVVVPILDFLAGKKILTREIMGALLAVFGIAFLELDGLQANIASGSDFVVSSGDLFSLVQPLAFGLGFWRMEHYMRKHPSEAMKLTAAQLSVVALSSITSYFLFSGSGDIPDMTQLTTWLTNPSIIGAVCWTGLITTALTVYMETLALKTLSAAETTMLFSTEPIFGGLCASAVLGEQFGVGGYIGGALVLGGCLFGSTGFGKQDV